MQRNRLAKLWVRKHFIFTYLWIQQITCIWQKGSRSNSGCYQEHIFDDIWGFTFVLINSLQPVMRISWEHLTLPKWFFLSCLLLFSFLIKKSEISTRNLRKVMQLIISIGALASQNALQLTKPLTWFQWSHWLWMFLLLSFSLGANTIPNLFNKRYYRSLFYLFQHKWGYCIFFGTMALCELII